ncbi:MAG: gliding motility-associated C-terminal domain-containing protein [Sphingobacteriaceae bacterium]|nr:gliding motility-associated C-terminal domain-containing protein [Sphingobacteriaceae bacterium]
MNLHTVTAQSDTLFWFAVPHVQHTTVQPDFPYRFHFINPSSDTVNVILDVPANTAILPSTLQLLPASSGFINVSAFSVNLVNQLPNIPQNRGVRIRASRKIQAYYEVGSIDCRCNQELFNLKGDPALGNVFYTAFQDQLHSDSSLSFVPYASIDMVAVENATVITIESPVNLFGISANIPVTVTLNAGQTYSIRSIDWRRQNKPNAVKITSSKRIAITIKDEQVRIGTCGDLTGDQILPVTSLKSQYPILKGNMQGADVITVVAVYDRTRIAFEGSAQSTITLNAGEYRSFLSNVAVQTVFANKPVALVQYSGIGCSVGMSVVPGLGCMLDSVYEYVRVNNDPLIFNFVVPVAYQDSIRVNGGPPGFIIPGVQFNPLPGTNISFWWAIFELNSNIIGAGMPVRISAPVGFSLGIRHGNPTQGMRFLYFGDYRGDPLFEIQADTLICEGDTVEIKAIYTHNATAKWTLPNGSVLLQDTVRIQGFTAVHSGWYKLEMIEHNCIKRVDSIYLEVGPSLSNILLLPPTRDTICQGDTLVLRNQMLAGTNRQWFNQGGAIAGATSDSLVVQNTGVYYAVASTPCGEPDTTASLAIFVEPEIAVVFQLSDSILCPGSEVLLLHASAVGSGRVYLRSPDGSIVDISLEDSLDLNQVGGYALWYQTSNCTFDTSFFELYPADYPAQLQFDRLLLCDNQTATLWSTGVALAYYWYKDGVLISSATDSVLTVSETGLYQLAVIPAAPCNPDTLWLDALYVYKAELLVDISASSNAGNIPLSVDFERLGRGGQHFQWYLNGSLMHADSIWQYVFERRGRFEIKLVVKDTLTNCSDSAVMSITAFDSSVVLVPTAFSPNNDGINDYYLPYIYNAELLDWAIYNRWGELIFMAKDLGMGWNGWQGSQPSPSGNYVCVIRYQPLFGEISVKSTDFLLIR